MAQTKYLTVLSTSATTVENFLRDIKKRMESCSGVPGIVYNFNSKNLVKFEDNFGAKGDLQMGIYFDYETATPPDNYFDPEQKKKNVCRIFCINCCVSSTFEYYKNSCSKKLWSLHKSINNIRLFI